MKKKNGLYMNLKALKYFFTAGREKARHTLEEKEGAGAGNYVLYGNNHLVQSEIGKHSYLGHNAIVYHTNIGNYCSVGPNVVIGYGDHPTDLLSTSPNYYFGVLDSKRQQEILAFANKRVKIGHDVWIGANAYIKNGIKIGTGAIVGANSFVNKDVEPYSIVVGSPARLLKYRFDPATVVKLLSSEWWNKDPKELKEYLEKKGLSLDTIK